MPPRSRRSAKAIERAHGRRTLYSSADMSKGHEVRGLVAATVEKFGRVDILVDNAGIQLTAPVEDFPAAKWDAILAVNQLGGTVTFLCSPAADPITGAAIAVHGGWTAL
jgi:NAD(P)-dependent dehydrogenase (short-subunit alcohol dehydrogenase family)